MANTTGKYGFRPIGPEDDASIYEFDIDPSSTAFGLNDPVKFVADKGVALATAGDPTVGIVVGVMDADGIPQNYYPSSATAYRAQVNINPHQRYMVKLTTSSAADIVGGNANLVAGTLNTYSGLSGAYIVTITTADQVFKIIGLADVSGNDWGTNQDVIVVINDNALFAQSGTGV